MTKFNNRETRDKIIQHLLIEKKIKKHVDIKSDKDNVSMTSSLPSTVRSDISSSFKFIGDLKNPYEVIKKTPDIDSVLMSLSKVGNIETVSLNLFAIPFHFQAQKNTLRNVTKRQTGDERVKEELFRDLSTTKDSTDTSATEMILNKTDLTKGLEPPWSWVQQFATVPQSEKSYNFVESDTTPAGETPTLLTDGSFDFCAGHFRDPTSDADDTTVASTGRTDGTDEKFKMFEDLLDEVIEGIGNAMSEGKCDIKNIQSICSVMSEHQFDDREEEMNVISGKLQKAEDGGAQFENLEELGNYLKEECTNELMQRASIEPLSKKLMECDIQIDENIATKEVPDDMILGLVESNESNEPNSESTATAVVDNKNDNAFSPASNSSDERKETIRMVGGFITDAIDEIQDSDVEAEENILPTFNCDMPALPGIGKACSPKVMDAFLVYILSQARQEKGMVYPRFLKEPNCPVMMNSLN